VIGFGFGFGLTLTPPLRLAQAPSSLSRSITTGASTIAIVQNTQKMAPDDSL